MKRDIPPPISSRPARVSVAGVLVLFALVGAQGVRSASAQSAEGESKNGTQTATVSNEPPNPELKLSPMEALRRFEPAANEEYTLGAGDEISIQYAGRPELSGKAVVGPDGRITLPLAGPVTVTNLTREEAAKKIDETMSSYYTQVSATVDVLVYASNHVTLLGPDVKNPGVIDFKQTPTLLEVLSRGGIQTRPDGNLPSECMIYRGDQVLYVDLQNLLATGSPLANLRLRRNDMVFVPPASARTITVLGQVMHPGAIILKHESTLVSVLGDAGGLSDSAGGNPEIQVIHRTKQGTTQLIRYKKLLSPTGGLEVSLYPGDVVYVPKSGGAKVAFVMQQIAPFVSLGTLAAVIH